MLSDDTLNLYKTNWQKKFAATAAKAGWELVFFDDNRRHKVQVKAIEGGPFTDDGLAWLHITTKHEAVHLAARRTVRECCMIEYTNMIAYCMNYRTAGFAVAA